MSVDQNNPDHSSGSSTGSSPPVWTLTDDDIARLQNIERLPQNSIWHGHDALKTLARSLRDKLDYFIEHPWLIDPARPVGQPSPYGVTVLGTDKPVGKTIYKFAGRWRKDAVEKVLHRDGTWKPVNAKYHSISLAECRTHEDFQTLLKTIESFPKICLIRGYPSTLSPYWMLAYRKKKAENGGHFADAPVSWVSVDIDGYPKDEKPEGGGPKIKRRMPDHLSYDRPEEIVEWLMTSEMPPCFRDVTCTWHVSSSGGTVKTDKANFHLVFFLTEPTTTEDIRLLLKAGDEYDILDIGAHTVVQPIYTARPTINPKKSDTMVDPMEGRRVGIWRGSKDVADLTVGIAAARAKLAAENATRDAKKAANLEKAIARERDPIMRAKLKRDGPPPRTDGQYMKVWDKIAREDMGVANGDTYNRPIYRLLKTAVESGCTDGWAIIEHVQSYVVAFARRCGDYEEYADRFEIYLSNDVLRRRLDDAAANADPPVEIIYTDK